MKIKEIEDLERLQCEVKEQHEKLVSLSTLNKNQSAIINELKAENRVLKAKVSDIENISKEQLGANYEAQELRAALLEYKEKSTTFYLQKVEAEEQIKNYKRQSLANKKEVIELTDLVADIERELLDDTKRQQNRVVKCLDLISYYRNLSPIGTTKILEINGKKYEVKVEKEVENGN